MKLKSPAPITNKPNRSVSRLLVPTLLALAMFPASFSQAEVINYPTTDHLKVEPEIGYSFGYLYPDANNTSNNTVIVSQNVDGETVNAVYGGHYYSDMMLNADNNDPISTNNNQIIIKQNVNVKVTVLGGKIQTNSGSLNNSVGTSKAEIMNNSISIDSVALPWSVEGGVCPSLD